MLLSSVATELRLNISTVMVSVLQHLGGQTITLVARPYPEVDPILVKAGIPYPDDTGYLPTNLFGRCSGYPWRSPGDTLQEKRPPTFVFSIFQRRQMEIDPQNECSRRWFWTLGPSPSGMNLFVGLESILG